MWNDDWDAVRASRLAREYQEEQRRLHEEKLAKRKAEREAARHAAKVRPEIEYPWLKEDGELS